jgi:hypothetical protein
MARPVRRRFRHDEGLDQPPRHAFERESRRVAALCVEQVGDIAGLPGKIEHDLLRDTDLSVDWRSSQLREDTVREVPEILSRDPSGDLRLELPDRPDKLRGPSPVEPSRLREHDPRTQIAITRGRRAQRRAPLRRHESTMPKAFLLHLPLR